MSLAFAQNNFSINLLREVVNENPNNSVIFSPISVAFVLSMLYAGAKEETAKQLAHALTGKTNRTFVEIHKHFSEQLHKFRVENENYTLEAVNRIYVNKQFPGYYFYNLKARLYYNGGYESVNFENGAEAAEHINNFVANQTHNKIKNMFEANQFNASTMMVLVNAVYFKGLWKSLFNKKNTYNRTFNSSADRKREVPTMFEVLKVPYYKDEDIIAIQLPYADNNITALFILPKKVNALDEVLQNFSYKKLSNILDSLNEEAVNIYLPRFHIESELRLDHALLRLGLREMFSIKANFRGITSELLKVDAVMQKALIEINEEGRETPPVIESTDAYYTFDANHPFLYFLVESTNNTVLFSGVVRMEEKNLFK